MIERRSADWFPAGFVDYAAGRMLQRLLYSPFLAQVVVTRKCNLSCTYCNEFDDFSPPVPTEDLRARLRKLKELGTWAVEWTGGEPMLHPDLFELTRYAKRELKFHKVMLISNAYLFNEDKIRQLNEAGLDELQVSIDGVNTNDVTIKVLKPLRKKLEAVIRAARFKVVLNAVIGSAPATEAMEVVTFARENGLRPRVCLIHGGDGQMKLSPEDLAVYNEIKTQMGRRFREAGDYRTRLMEDNRAPFKCRAGSRYLYVDELGMVRWCSQQRESWGKPLLEYTRADLKQQFFTRKDCNDHCTVGCVRTCSNPDEWREQPLAAEPAGLVQIRPA
jgi:MoaA/NifB/PqqE/SkfB family radical SAM enzyme